MTQHTTFEAVKKHLLHEPKSWLVTGNAGFIGSNLVEFLLRHNQKVTGVDNFSTGYRHNIEEVLLQVGKEAAQRFNFIEGDLTDYATCIQACEGVDIVLHQAALGSVPRSLADPLTSNHANVTGFLNMLTAAKTSGIQRFVYASSSSVYGDSPSLPKVEAVTGELLSPYAVTKKTNELYAGVFKKSYGMETIGLRYFNVFGKRQDPEGAYAAVIPKWIGALLRGEAVYINGDGDTSRDFTYIDNVVQMNILAALSASPEAYGEIFNVAAGGRNTLNELYGFITEALNTQTTIKHTPPLYREFRPGDIRHSHADISKAQHLFGYTPTHTLQQGLHETAPWYINRLS
jgi:UDP-N-acetylglucosamine 4-epimerase